MGISLSILPTTFGHAVVQYLTNFYKRMSKKSSYHVKILCFKKWQEMLHVVKQKDGIHHYKALKFIMTSWYISA